jgi:hypothetical protein
VSTNFEMYDGKREEIRHLGQRAGGWRFLFRAWPDLGITDTQAWLKQLDDAEWIKDEYGRKYTRDEFLEAVEACEQGSQRGLYGRDWYDKEGNAFCEAEFS